MDIEATIEEFLFARNARKEEEAKLKKLKEEEAKIGRA